MSDSSPDDRTADKSEKSASAFRTISEVAAELDLPQHVLRFWETKFPQVRPMKRGGGRNGLLGRDERVGAENDAVVERERKESERRGIVRP